MNGVFSPQYCIIGLIDFSSLSHSVIPKESNTFLDAKSTLAKPLAMYPVTEFPVNSCVVSSVQSNILYPRYAGIILLNAIALAIPLKLVVLAEEKPNPKALFISSERRVSMNIGYSVA